MRDFFQHE